MQKLTKQKAKIKRIINIFSIPVSILVFCVGTMVAMHMSLIFGGVAIDSVMDENLGADELEVIELTPDKVFDYKYADDYVKYAYYDKEVPTFDGENIEKRTPTSWTKSTGKDRNGVDLINGLEEVTMFSQGAFVKLDDKKWYYTEYATTTKEKFEKQKDKTKVKDAEKLGMFAFVHTAEAQTYYPDPHPESTSFDGYSQSTGAVYLTVRNLSTDNGATTDTDDGTGNAFPQHSLYAGIYYIMRGFFLFDTSALDDSATITSATFSLYYNGNANDADNDDVHLVSSNPASNTAISANDYDQLGETSFGSMDVAGTAGAYNDITINATGIAAISLTGITKYGVRMGRDITATAPTGLNQRLVYFADYTGTDRDPKLVVTVSTGGGAVNYGYGPQVMWFE